MALCPQACHVEGGSAGLVPSQLLEEKRKAFVKRDGEVAPTSGTGTSAWPRGTRLWEQGMEGPPPKGGARRVPCAL